MDDLKHRMKEWGEYDPGHIIPQALARIEALEASVAAADKLADQAQMVKDFRYDPNIGVQLNFLEEALAAYQATKEQSK